MNTTATQSRLYRGETLRHILVIIEKVTFCFKSKTLTKLLQCGCLHLCWKIFSLQQIFICLFCCSVFLLQRKKWGGEKCETERLLEPDRRDGVLWFYLDTHKDSKIVPQTGNDHTHRERGGSEWQKTGQTQHVRQL